MPWGGCTTTTDHLYLHPRGAGDLIGAEIAAARELGFRFHPTRGSMSLSVKDGGLPPDEVVQEEDEILADSERLVALHHDPAPGAMVRVALAPCSPFSVTPELMRRTAELAERLDVRLHTHLAEDLDEDRFCEAVFGCRPIEHFERVGWGSARAWVAHCVHPNQAEIERLGRWGTGVAHCPSSNQILGAGLAPVRELRDAGVPVGIGCDGSASADCASLWLETRGALLLARLRGGAGAMQAREALEMATLGGAACLGRDDIGALTPGRAGDVVVWPCGATAGVTFAGALSDPVEALLRCGPIAPRHTIVAGRALVADGRLTAGGVEQMLRRHRGHRRGVAGRRRVRTMTARHTEYTIRGVPSALDAALRRRAQERGASLNQTVIDALAAALGVAGAGGDAGEPDSTAGGEGVGGLERDALDEGVWL